MKKEDDLLGVLYCTKHDDFISNLQSDDLICQYHHDCDQCSRCHIVTTMTMKAIMKNGEVLDLE